MRVLVTGSSGFIGRHVREALKLRGAETIPYGLPSDVTNRDGMREACENADAVINLAGVLGTHELFGSEAAAAEVNILGAVSVYDAARAAGIPVVQIGTGHKGQLNPYAITKAAAEDLGLARAQWLGEKIAVVRAYHVYGPGQYPGKPHGPAAVHKFFPEFACAAIEGRPLELCGGGTQIIDPVHVTDVAEVIAGAVDGPYGEVTEAGAGAGITVWQVAEDIRDVAESASELRAVAGRAGETPGAVVVAQKPRCVRLWPAQVPDTVAWYREWLSGRYSAELRSASSVA